MLEHHSVSPRFCEVIIFKKLQFVKNIALRVFAPLVDEKTHSGASKSRFLNRPTESLQRGNRGKLRVIQKIKSFRSSLIFF